MKQRSKPIWIPLFLALCIAPCACAPRPASASVDSPVPALNTPAPTPTPAPSPVIAVFGAEASGSFQEGIVSSAEEGLYPVKFVDGGVSALTAYQTLAPCAVIVYLEGAYDSVPAVAHPVYYYAANGQSIPYGIQHLRYFDSNAAQVALDCALAYPPHLAPVRMIGLFSSRESRAYAVWSAAAGHGLVFSKREYIAAESEEPLSDWLTDIFSRYFPGMLDAVYAEDGALAVAAADKLASLGRDDMEVFSAGTDAQADLALSPILVCAVGANQRAAGGLCYEQAVRLLLGEPAQSGILLPEVFWYPAAP